MKLKELHFANWNGNFATIGVYNDIHLLLLNCIVSKGYNGNLSNLVAFNFESEVIWIAAIPENVLTTVSAVFAKTYRKSKSPFYPKYFPPF